MLGLITETPERFYYPFVKQHKIILLSQPLLPASGIFAN
jgi:hypothetical protein